MTSSGESQRTPRALYWAAAAALGLVLLLAGCGGGSASGAKPVASIAIDRSALLLTAANQEHRLSAQARDADGEPVDATVTWTSSAPEQVTVAADGTVRSVTAVGSAQIVASVDGVQSTSVFVAVVELRENTLLLRDADIVGAGAPTNVAAGEYPGLGTRYEVVVSGVAAPAPGTFVLAVETAQVAGRVVSSTVDGAVVRVELEVVSAPDLLKRYDVHWTIDLAGYAPAGARPSATTARGDRKHALADTNILPRWKLPAEGEGPLSCEGEAKAYLNVKPVQVSFEGSPKLEIVSSRLDDTLPPGRLRVALVGDLVLVTTLGLTAEAGLKGEVKCELKDRIPLPFLPPPIGPFVRLAVPIGIGASIDGAVEIAAIDISLQGKNGAHLELGIDCQGTAPCTSLDTAQPINEFTPKAQISSLPQEGLRIKLGAQVYLLSGVDVVALLSPFNVIDIKAGPKLAGDFGSVPLQTGSSTYASNYDFKLQLEAGPGSSLKKAIQTLMGGEDRGSLDATLKLAMDISESPNGTFTVDRERALPGRDSVKLTVDLKAKSLEFFKYGYNVKEIRIYRRLEDVNREFELFDTLPAAPGQSHFEKIWQPTAQDAGKNEFAALVVTLLPPLVEPELEVAADSIRTVKVDCVSAPGSAGRARALAASCSSDYFGTADGEITGAQRFNASVTWKLDPVKMADPNRKAYEAFYKPSGSVHIDMIVYTDLGCTVEPHDVSRFDETSMLYINTATSPPSYAFVLQAHADLRIDCPNTPTMTIPAASLLTIDGAGALTDRGGIVDNKVTPGGRYSYAFNPGSPP